MSSNPKTDPNLDVREHGWDADSRTITIHWRKSELRSQKESTKISVSPRYGAVSSIECKKDYILLHTEEGKAAYEYSGRIPWSKLRAELMNRLHERFRRRVKFEILLIRYRGGGSGTGGARARIYVDGEIIGSGLYDGGDFTTKELGSAIAEYLELSPFEAMRSEDVLISAIALLDRGTPEAPVAKASKNDHPVWKAFFELRYPNQSGGEQVGADQEATRRESKA